METNFTLTSGSVDGFRSTWNVEGGERDVETKGTGTETIRTTEQGTTCEEYSTSISVRILHYIFIVQKKTFLLFITVSNRQNHWIKGLDTGRRVQIKHLA